MFSSSIYIYFSKFLIKCYIIDAIYRLVNLKDSLDVEKFHFNANLWDLISIVSACTNTISVFFVVAANLEDRLIPKATRMLNTSNFIVLGYFLLLLGNIYISSTKGRIFSNFILILDDSRMKELSDKFLEDLSYVWICVNICNQVLLIDFYYRIIMKYVLRSKTKENYFEGGKFIISTFSIIILSSTIVCLFMNFLTYELDPYLLIVLMTGILGVTINYFFPLILYIKFSKREIISWYIFFLVGIAYCLMVICFGSFLNNTLFYKEYYKL